MAKGDGNTTLKWIDETKFTFVIRRVAMNLNDIKDRKYLVPDLDLPPYFYIDVFQRFVAKIDGPKSEVIEQSWITLASRLWGLGRGIFQHENGKTDMFIKAWNKQAPPNLEMKTRVKDAFTDGVVLQGNLPCLIMEDKCRTCVPDHTLDQATQYYLKLLNKAGEHDALPACRIGVPCYVLSYCGGLFGIYGICCVGNYLIRYPFWERGFYAMTLDEFDEFAHVLKCLFGSLGELSEALKLKKGHPKSLPLCISECKIGTTTFSLRNIQWAFPKKHQFLFRASGEAEGHKPVPLVIKGALRYSVQAHQLLANHDLAPKLHFAENIGRGIHLIVMESLWEYRPLTDLDQEALETRVLVLREAKNALELLHKNGLAHGDFRLANILYSTSKGQVTVRIIDFDFSGEIGKVRYPPDLNTEAEWPEGVDAGSVVQKEHDWAHFNEFLKFFNVELL